MFVEGQPTDEICTTIYEYTASSTLTTTTQTCQQPLITFSLYLFDIILIIGTAYLIIKFLQKKYI